MNDRASTSSNSPAGCFVHLAWMLFGNVALFILALYIWRESSPFLSWPDFAYWGVVAAMLVFRYLDIHFFAGQNAYGQSSTMKDWSRYMTILIVIAGLIFAGAHARPFLA